MQQKTQQRKKIPWKGNKNRSLTYEKLLKLLNLIKVRNEIELLSKNPFFNYQTGKDLKAW